MSGVNKVVNGYTCISDVLYKKGYHNTEAIVQQFTTLGGFKGLGDDDAEIRMFRCCASIVCLEYAEGIRKL